MLKDLHALKSRRVGQPNLAHDTETKKIRKNKKKTKTEWLRRNGPGNGP